MLNVMREYKGHWILKGILVLVALSMTAYLGYYFTSDSQSMLAGDWVAKVGDRSIETREFQRVAQNLDNQFRTSFGEQYEQIRPNLRLGTRALASLVQREMVLVEADRLGLTATKKEIQDAVVGDPNFQGADGKFVGKDRYLEVMSRYPGGAAAYETALSDEIVARKWRALATESAYVSDADVERAFRERTEKTAVDYALVKAGDRTVPTTVTDAEATAWYDAHRDDYLRDTARKIRYVVVSRQDQLDKVDITDDAIAAFYDENREAYRHGSERRARHILFRVGSDASAADREAAQAEARATIKRLRSGADFAELARAVSQDPGSAAQGGDLGWFGRSVMVPAFETAVFDAPVGTLLDEPVATDFGYHVIEVTGAREEGVTPLDEVRDDIRRQLAARQAQDLLRAAADELAGRIATPADLGPVAQEAGLTVAEATVTASDRMADLAPSPEFRDAVQGMEAGTVRGPLGVARGLAIVAVDEIIPAAVAPFEEVAAQVRTAVLNQRQRDAAVAAAEQALGRRGDLAAAARSLGVEVRESGDLAPGPVRLPGTGGGEDALAARFFAADLGEGDTGIVEVPTGAVIYRVTRRVPFDPVMFEASRAGLREELLDQKRSELLGAILGRLQGQMDIQVNDEVVARYDR